ncbi:MAG TPA: pilus assembly protein PilN [Desulfobacterales bacterium]|nr:pilus assembly protein PilN [Desulfobacterales bacterium]
MIRINLLPYRLARKKENIRRQVSIFCLFFILVFFSFFYFQTILNTRIEKLNTQIDATKKEVDKYRKITREIDAIIKNLAVLKKKTAVINNLEMDRKRPVKLLETMTQVVVPKRMWFTSLTSGNRTVGINGIALDNKTIADFMTRLEGSKLFSAVNLKSIKQQNIKRVNLNLKMFAITSNKVGVKQTPAKAKRKK